MRAHVVTLRTRAPGTEAAQQKDVKLRQQSRSAPGLAAPALATAAFGVVHSLLASSTAKDGAARIFGTRARNAFYRPFFIAQSFASLAALAAVVFKGRSRTLYEVRGAPAIAMQILRTSGIAYAVWAVRHIGFEEITGLRGLAQWSRGEEHVDPEPEAQGPARKGGMALDTGGPFALSRHPLNLSPLPVFWLAPKMTTRWLAFSVAATAYLVLGSRHEEARLARAHGRQRYDRYRRRVPFFVPRAPQRSLTLRGLVR